MSLSRCFFRASITLARLYLALLLPLTIVAAPLPTAVSPHGTLLRGGYTLDQVTPVDQFRYSHHVELVGVFSKPFVRKKR